MIEHVKAPVFIMHGEADVEVPVAHGKLLSTKCKNLYYPWWVPEGNHHDLDIKFRTTYFVKLSKFIKHVKEIVMRKTDSQLDELYRAKSWHDTFDHIYFKNEKAIIDKWNKGEKDSNRPKDYYLVPSNSSFVNSQNITAYTYKNNTAESLFTTMGDQTARKNGQDSARTAFESDTGM